MNSLEILRSFTDEEFYKVWCIVHYKFNGKRDTFWERSRNRNELKVGIPCNVPGEELKVYNKPLHAEKYAIGRLKIKLRNETISLNESWWVNMYINKPPCNGYYRPCVTTIKEFASKYPSIKVTVKYTGNVEEINTDSLQNLRIAPFNVMNWKFLIGRIIKLKRDQHSDDIKLRARLRGIWKAKKNMEEKEIRYVLSKILSEHQ